MHVRERTRCSRSQREIRKGGGDASAQSKLNSWRLLKLIKIKSARSRLYRSRFLQVNTRWKALAEIYTMHSFAPLLESICENWGKKGLAKTTPFSNLNFFAKKCWNVCWFLKNFCKICQNFAEVFAESCQILIKKFRDFPKMQHFLKIAGRSYGERSKVQKVRKFKGKKFEAKTNEFWIQLKSFFATQSEVRSTALRYAWDASEPAGRLLISCTSKSTILVGNSWNVLCALKLRVFFPVWLEVIRVCIGRSSMLILPTSFYLFHREFVVVTTY